jgi:hypothetical protein
MHVCTLISPDKKMREDVMGNNQNSARQLAASLRELADMGSAVDLSAPDTYTKDEPADIEIEQVGSVQESRIFDLANGLTGLHALLKSDQSDVAGNLL